MITLTFRKVGADDIVLSEDDLFDFDYEHSCFSGDTFELGGVNARRLCLIIDNNGQWYSRGTFANSRVALAIDGNYVADFNVELPKRRNGVIEITAYDDITKLDTEYPTDYTFPQTFGAVYAQCLYEAGLWSSASTFDGFVNNGVSTTGVISHEYTDYIYTNSCRQLVSGMAEWNGGFCFINDSGKLHIQPFAKEISKEFTSSELMDFDYSDETVTFTKIKTSQKNKTYELGTDDGYTLVIRNQYIQYGLSDEVFEEFMSAIYDYYNGFTLTPMSFTLAEPDFSLKIGDRISVYDAEENVTVVGNISKIQMSGNLSMTITCGGFGNVNSTSGYNPTSVSQTEQAKKSAQTCAQRLQTASDSIIAETSAQGMMLKNITDQRVFIVNDIGDGVLMQFDPDSDLFSSPYMRSFIQFMIGAVNINASYEGKKESRTVNLTIGDDGVTASLDRYDKTSNITIDNILSIKQISGEPGVDIVCSGGAYISSLVPTPWSQTLSFRPDGIYIGGKKVLTEE